MTDPAAELDLWQARSLARAQDHADAAAAAAAALPRGIPAPDSAAVVGAGAMGRGIALALAASGRPVVLIDSDEARVAAARTFLSAWAVREAAKPGRDAAAAEAALARIACGCDLAAIGEAGIVIESIPEDMALKQALFARIDRHAREGAILASNSSTLDIDRIAAATARPQQVIGTHFFIPAQVTRLLELIPGRLTAPDVTAAAAALALALGKLPVVAGNCDGFIGNRLFDRLHEEAMYLVEEGASPVEVDAALEGWGMAIGPFRTLDMIDNRLLWSVRKRRRADDPARPTPVVGDRLCEAGLAGVATGAGWYLYEPGSRRRRPNPVVEALAADSARELGLERRGIAAQEIVGRCMVAVIAEALEVLAQGFAQNAADLDAVFRIGYGFPADRGGPLFLGEAVGLDRLAALAGRHDRVAGRGKARAAAFGARVRPPFSQEDAA